jgi:hypothetical protein
MHIDSAQVQGSIGGTAAVTEKRDQKMQCSGLWRTHSICDGARPLRGAAQRLCVVVRRGARGAQ